MKLREIIEVFRNLADSHAQIESFNTGLVSEHNDSVIQYPALRLVLPYTIGTDIESDNSLFTYTFKMSLLVCDVEKVTGSNSYSVNTNYVVQQDNSNEIDTPLVDETLLREKALKIMMTYIEGLRMLEAEEYYGYFTIEGYSFDKSLERYANDYVTGVEISLTIKTTNDYKCEALENFENSVWKDENDNQLNINYNPVEEIIPSINCWTIFDGVKEYVDLGLTDIIPNGSTECSYSLWTKCDPQADNAAIYGSYGGGSNSLSPLIGILTNGTVRFWMQTTAANSRTSDITVHDGLLHNIICVFKGLTSMDIYIDGVLHNGSMAGTIAASTPASAFITSMAASSGRASFYKGTMDEVSVYDVALTPAEITTIYNKGILNVDYSALNGIKAHWHMDTLNPVDVIGGVNGISVNIDETNIECEET